MELPGVATDIGVLYTLIGLAFSTLLALSVLLSIEVFSTSRFHKI